MNKEQYFLSIFQDYTKYLDGCEEDGKKAMDLISFACLGYDIGDDDELCSEFIKWTENHK